jgi:hypothetical protein
MTTAHSPACPACLTHYRPGLRINTKVSRPLYQVTGQESILSQTGQQAALCILFHQNREAFKAWGCVFEQQNQTVQTLNTFLSIKLSPGESL